MNTSQKLLLSGASIALMAFATQAAQAQTAPPSPAAQASGSGEVVVTARRRAENAQKVPISIIALNTQQLSEQNVTSTNDLSRVAPGLSIMNTSASHETSDYSIRGQGSTFGTGPGVIPYFAEVANFGQSSPNGLFDLGSVQVLKGPQGTLFGRNTTGGAVLLTPIMPTDQWSGYIDTRLGNYGRRDLEFGIGGPIFGDKLSFRISGQTLNRDGYTTYLLDGTKQDNENSNGIRAIVVFKPIENLKNTTIFQGTTYNTNGNGAILSHVSPAAAPLLGPDLVLAQHLGIRTALGDFPDHWDDIAQLGVINTTEWRLNNIFSLKNILSYTRVQGSRAWDLDGTNVALIGVVNPRSNQYLETEEIQGRAELGPVQATAGYYYEHSWAPYQAGFLEETPAGGLAAAESAHATSQAVYAQIDWKILPKLNFTAGARYTDDSQYEGATGEAFLAPGYSLNVPSLTPGPAGFNIVAPPEEVTFNSITWNFALDYTVNPGLNLYGHISRGVKDGGFNGTAPPGLGLYFPEYVIDYEAGFKGQHDFGSWKVRYDIDGFYDDYTNIQRSQNVVVGTPPNIAILTFVTNNAGGAPTTGFISGAELQLTVIPSRYFQVAANYTYMVSKYTHYENLALDPLNNQHFPNAPTHQLQITPTITFPIPANIGRLTASATVYYQSSFSTDAYNQLIPDPNPALTPSRGLVNADVPGATLPGYTNVNFRVDWRHIYGTSVSAAFYVLNAFNAKYATGTDNGLNTEGFETALYAPPTMYGVELRYEFGGGSH